MTNPPIPAQRTWHVGDTIDDKLLNSQVRDAVNFLLNPPVMIANVGGGNTLASGHWIVLNIGSNTLLDTYGGVAPYNATSNPSQSKYIAPLSGVYRVVGQVQIAAANSNFAGPFRSIQVRVNGIGMAKLQVPALLNYSTDLFTCTDVYLNAGDTCEVAVFNGDNTTVGMVGDDLAGYGRVSMIWTHR